MSSQKTFERLEEHGPSYLPKKNCILTIEYWDNGKVFVVLLKTFSEVTLKFSVSCDFKHIFPRNVFGLRNRSRILIVQ